MPIKITKAKKLKTTLNTLWEDEFEVQGNVTNFKVINNTTYLLNGLYPNDDEFSFEIPDMTVLECTLDNGSTTLLPFSKKAISKTEKVDTKKGMTFYVHLKSIREVVNPMTGVYILKDDYPKELLELYNDEEE
jgi:hypothetical protein